MPLSPILRRARPAVGALATLCAIALALPQGHALAQAGSGAPPARIEGTALDSLRGERLENAIVQLMDGETARREFITTKDGKFAFDSLPEGTYSLRMLHLTLDTLGLAITSPTFALPAGKLAEVDMAIPPVRKLAILLCGPDAMLRGPSVVAGVIRDPDTLEPIPGVLVQLDHTSQDVFGLIKTPALRSTKSDANGRFKICGLPERLTGVLVATREGVSTGEVPVKLDDNLLSMTGLSFSLGNRAVTLPSDTAPSKFIRVFVGKGKLSGKVINDRGEAVEGAQVRVTGTLATAITDARGLFSLDSLPSGSQTVEIKKLGYGSTERAVEIATLPSPIPVTLTMDKAPALLPTTVTTAKSPTEKAFDKYGISERIKSHPGGTFRYGDNLLNHTMLFTDMVRNIAGLKVRKDPGPEGKQYLEPATGGIKVCLNYIIDGAAYKLMQKGDLDNELQPDLVQAIEYYTSSQVPAEFFGRGGPTECAVLVIWTTAKIPPKKDR